jgi:hypothetical protein
VAVGSTSEKTWDRPGPDAGLEALITRARALCPALAQAPVAERWAGIRPRAPGNAPMVGPLAGFDRLIVAAGGYKTGLGIARARPHAIRCPRNSRRSAILAARRAGKAEFANSLTRSLTASGWHGLSHLLLRAFPKR